MRYSLGEKMPTAGWEDSQPVEAGTGRDPLGWHALVHVLPLGLAPYRRREFCEAS